MTMNGKNESIRCTIKSQKDKAKSCERLCSMAVLTANWRAKQRYKVQLKTK